jgi:hypothetical protein
MCLKAILGPFAISVALLSVSPAFAAPVKHPHWPHSWLPGAMDDAQPKANEPPLEYDFCVSPPVEYEASTEPPPGCPGDTGPVR